MLQSPTGAHLTPRPAFPECCVPSQGEPTPYSFFGVTAESVTKGFGAIGPHTDTAADGKSEQ